MGTSRGPVLGAEGPLERQEDVGELWSGQNRSLAKPACPHLHPSWSPYCGYTSPLLWRLGRTWSPRGGCGAAGGSMGPSVTLAQGWASERTLSGEGDALHPGTDPLGRGACPRFRRGSCLVAAGTGSSWLGC